MHVPVFNLDLLHSDRLGPRVGGEHRQTTPDDQRSEDNVQIPREIDITAVLHSQVVAQELEGNNVQQALETVDGSGNADGLDALGDTLITLIAENDGLGLAGGDLGKGGLDLGVERVLGHDDDDGHVLINEGKGTMLQLSSKDT